jgi:DNA invertase Pin-like site-specific DNA recombinase
LERFRKAGSAPRPQLDAVLAALKTNDTLVVTGLSRLARSGAGEMINILTELTARGVKFHSLDEPWADTEDHMGKFMVSVFADMHQLFRRIQLEAAEDGRGARTQSGGMRPMFASLHQLDLTPQIRCLLMLAARLFGRSTTND